MTTNYNTLQIDTPENVTFGYEIAGIGSRFLAAFVDAILLGIVEGIIFGTLMAVMLIFEPVINNDLEIWIAAAFSIVGFIFFWGYHSFFEILWNGQTPGKRLAGVRVIRLDGTPVAATEILIRNLIRIFDFLPLAYGVGVVTMFVNLNSRRLGDLAAGTIVVHDHRPVSLKELSTWHVASGTALEAQSILPVEKLDYKDLLLIEDYLARRETLSNRLALAVFILKSIAAKHGVTLETINSYKAESVLQDIHSSIQKHSTDDAPPPLP
jgi:uncharacterized RDD family membrane protein YckC